MKFWNDVDYDGPLVVSDTVSRLSISCGSLEILALKVAIELRSQCKHIFFFVKIRSQFQWDEFKIT